MRGFLPYPIIATMFKTLIPTKFAFEMILTGKNWDAKQSMDAGLINRVVPHEQLQDEAWKWGERSAIRQSDAEILQDGGAFVDGSRQRTAWPRRSRG